MIDWLTAVIPLKHPRVNNGHLVSVDSDGLERWNVAMPRSFEGSYESFIQVKSNDLTECLQFGTMLYISGNPSKFLQGHNVVGTDDLNLLTERVLDALAPLCGFFLDSVTRQRIRQGLYYVKRLDINYYFELPSLGDVRAFIDASATKTKTRHGRSTVKKGTFYLGQHSKRWSFKGYSKYDEIMSGERGHRLPPRLLNTPLLAYAENKLRLELVLRAPELKKIADNETPTARQILDVGIQNLFNQYLSRLDMTANVSLRDEVMASLPSKLQGTYALWRQGYDVRTCVSRATFARHKKELMPFQIDISLPFHDADTPAGNVVPLLRVLEAKPCAIPSNLQLYIVH
jgi:II/X family phage/plasmid replication protein